MKIENTKVEPRPLTRDELIPGQVYRYLYDFGGDTRTSYVLACREAATNDIRLYGLDDTAPGESFAGDAHNARFYPVTATLRVSE